MISVCIPSKDAGPAFAANLHALREQRLDEEVEIVVVDSSSRDGTADAARAAGARVLVIPPEEFNHGRTRNLLAQQARGDILVFSVQDARPAHPRFLAELTEPLRADPELSGVTGKEIPHPDADLIARWEVEQHNRLTDRGPRRKHMPAPAAYEAASFGQRLDWVGFDNVCGALRRSAWEEFPFAELEFAEDVDWGRRVLEASGVLLHNPAALIHHSHNYTPEKRLRRYFVGRLALNRILRMPAVPPAPVRRVREAMDELRNDIEVFCTSLNGDRTPQYLLRLRRPPRYLFVRGWKKLRLPVSQVIERILWSNHPANRLREYFNFVAWNLGNEYGPFNAEQAGELVRQLYAIVMGSFLADQYYACERASEIPDWLSNLRASLEADWQAGG